MYKRFSITCLFLSILLMGCYQDKRVELNNPVFCGAEKRINVEGKSLFYSSGYRFQGGESRSDEEAYSGQFSSKLDTNTAFGLTYKIENLVPGQYLEVSVLRKSKSKKGVLVVSASGEQQAHMYLKESTPLYYEENGWGRLILNATIPNGVNAISVYCYNPNDEPAYFDNIKITLHESRPIHYDDQKILKIELSDSSIARLNAMRYLAKEQGIISKDQKKYMVATACYNKDTIPIKIRFKGDWTDHLENDKWSFRINVADGHSINGLKSFSIQNPRTRSYLKEWIMHKMFEQENVMTTHYAFIPVFLNGKNLGIYAVEEHFDKQLVESQKRREGPILKFDEEGFWEQNLFYEKTGASIKVPYYEASVITPFKKNRTMRSAVLKPQYLIAQNLMREYKEGKGDMENIFNPEQIAMFLALCDLGKAWHGLRWHNQRFYYNPITAVLEPIGFDLYGPSPDNSPFRLSPRKVNQQDYLFHQLLNNPVIRDHYISALVKVSSPSFLNDFINGVQEELTHLEQFLGLEYKGYQFDLTKFQENAEEIADSLRTHKKIENTASVFYCPEQSYSTIKSAHYFKGTGVKAYREQYANGATNISIQNYHIAPVHVLGYSLMEAADSMVFFNHAIELPSFKKQPGDVEIKVRGNVKKLFFHGANTKNKIHSANLINWPSPQGISPKEELLKKHPFGKSKYYRVSNGVVVFQGRHTINRFIYIPPGHRVAFMPGTQLNFINKAGLLSYSPIEMSGTKELPITIRSSDGSMMGFSIMHADSSSMISHTNFIGLNTLNYKGWSLTGAVTFYDSEVHLENCNFSNSWCEDALNIINTHFVAVNCSIKNSASDGFDGDFTTGTINNCRMENIGNDAIDFSGSKVQITHTSISYSGDKGVSGGEGSTLSVDNCVIDNSNIAIASKDNSLIRVSNTTLENSKIGFAAYRKKDEFGPAQIKARDILQQSIANLPLLDLNSRISIEGETLRGIKRINVDSLYPAFQ